MKSSELRALHVAIGCLANTKDINNDIKKESLEELGNVERRETLKTEGKE